MLNITAIFVRLLDMKKPVMLRPISLIVLSLFASEACATEVRYACADGMWLTVIFSPPESVPGLAQLAVAGSSTAITLPQVLSADGGRYANDDTEFWIKGNQARLTRAGKVTTCEARQAP